MKISEPKSRIGLRAYELNRLRAAFSLLELLIYMALLAIVMVGITSVFIAIEGGNARNQVQSEVNSNLRFAVEKIESDLRGATAVSAPVLAGAGSGVLAFTNASGTITYCTTGGALRRQVSSGALDAWTTTTQTPSTIELHSSVVNNGYVYAIGGSPDNVNATATVRFALINATGSLGAWTTTTQLPSALYSHTSVANNGYMYAIGGTQDSVNGTTTVRFALINATGSLGAWTTTTPLLGALFSHTSVVNNGYVYVMGGTDGLNTTATVRFAQVNATGSLGAWTTTNQLPGAVNSHMSVVNNGYVYAIGGYTGANTTATVSFAQVNATGSLGAWTKTTQLPDALYSHASVANNGYMYAIGGTKDGLSATTTVSFALVNATGSLGVWTTTTQLPGAIDVHTSVVNNGYVYAIGGAGSALTSTVLYNVVGCSSSSEAITANTVNVNSATFTRLENTNTVLNKTVVSVQTDIAMSYNSTAPDSQYSEEKITTTALRN